MAVKYKSRKTTS